MNLSQAYEMFMQEQKFRGNSQETISYYKICLNMFIDYCGSDLDVSDLALFVLKLCLFLILVKSHYIS